MTLDEVNAILATRGYSADFIHDDWRAESFNGVLLMRREINPSVVEIHVVVPPSAMRQCFDTCRQIIDAMAALGYLFVLTTIPAGQYKTSHKLARRMGFRQIDCYNDDIIYIREAQ